MIKTDKKLEKDEILNIYKKGFKKPTEFCIGLEYERLPL